jgi:hemolysin D
MISWFDSLKDAWINRHALGDGGKSQALNAFLPAALEIEATPPNPLTRWLARSIVALLVIFVIWALVGEVNIVASAQGKILPGSRVKMVQPLEKGVIKKIFVNEGEYVTQGQALIELDATRTGADEKRLDSELRNARMELAVNEALIKRLNSKQGRGDGDEKGQLDYQQWAGEIGSQQSHFITLLHEKWQQYRSQIAALINAREAAEAEYEATKIEIGKLKMTLPIITKRAKITKGLYERKYASETEYLELEQTRIEQAHQLSAEKQHLSQLRAARDQAQRQIDTLHAETKASVLTEITQNRREITALKEELVKARDINQRQILYAPVSGQVQELAVNTEGGVVT